MTSRTRGVASRAFHMYHASGVGLWWLALIGLAISRPDYGFAAFLTGVGIVGLLVQRWRRR